MKQCQQSFLDIYETVFSVHSSIIDFSPNSYSKEPIFYILSGIRLLLMSDSKLFNCKKSFFFHQVALVGKNGFLFRSLI